MKIIQIPIKKDEMRPAFDHVPTELSTFNQGQRVLSAYDFENPNETSIYFERRHEPGEPNWPEGGYECRDIGGGFRAFFLDALVLHPSQIKTSQNFVKNSKRGRPKRTVINIDGTESEPEVKTSKRGRPRKYAEGESPSALAKAVKEQDTTIKRGRGRPAKNPSELKEVVKYVATGIGRGRPKKYEDGQSPSALKKLADAKLRAQNINDPNKPGRGRPRKIIE